MRLTVNVCPEGHWTLGSIEPGITCGTCGGEYTQQTLAPAEITDEMVERAAQAIAACEFRDWDAPDNEMGESYKDTFRRQARTALTAALTPTESNHKEQA